MDLLAVAVALLAAVCLRLRHIINLKNKVLVQFIDENIKLKDTITDLEIEIERCYKVIRTLRDRQDDDSDGDSDSNASSCVGLERMA